LKKQTDANNWKDSFTYKRMKLSKFIGFMTRVSELYVKKIRKFVSSILKLKSWKDS